MIVQPDREATLTAICCYACALALSVVSALSCDSYRLAERVADAAATVAGPSDPSAREDGGR